MIQALSYITMLLIQQRLQVHLWGYYLRYRYYRLPLPMEGAPLEEDFDAFVNILRVSIHKNVSPIVKSAFFGGALLVESGCH